MRGREAATDRDDGGGGREEKRKTGRSEGKSITQIQLSAELAAGPGERGEAGESESERAKSNWAPTSVCFLSCFSFLSARPLAPLTPTTLPGRCPRHPALKKIYIPSFCLSQLIRCFLVPPRPGGNARRLPPGAVRSLLANIHQLLMGAGGARLAGASP